MNIEIELSPQSVDKALQKLNLNFDLDLICQNLALLGANEAMHRFLRGDYGNTDVNVDVEPTENGYKIVASGKDVYFVEFGTGIFAHPNGYTTSIPVYPGSYSETHAKQFSTNQFWFYEGEKLQGTEAQNAMYHAGRVIRENASRVIQEVLGR